MADDRSEVIAHMDAEELGSRRPVGVLTRQRATGRSVISFAYESDWIGSGRSFPIDPTLPLFEGEQYPGSLPGIFNDAAPDRWGRTLLERREALSARRQERRPRRLDEWDFLLGVSDETRMGALRLTEANGEAFLSDHGLAVPPIARLRELEHWARELEHGLSTEMTDEDRWVSMLVGPGSSLGGARPKASFRDEDGHLWIAKFPSREDRYDVGCWEYVVSRLAGEAGIETPTTGTIKLGSRFRTFISKRFDRERGRRRLYASAMTLAGRSDNDEASYLDIARAITDHGDPQAIESDLGQLFRRAVFNVITSNRDDHLRNHGFLRSTRGWRLAPAFDMNPTPVKHEHALALDDRVHIPDLDILAETAPLYRLSAARAGEIITEVTDAVSRWRDLARELGVDEGEIDRMTDAFAVVRE